MIYVYMNDTTNCYVMYDRIVRHTVQVNTKDRSPKGKTGVIVRFKWGGVTS